MDDTSAVPGFAAANRRVEVEKALERADKRDAPLIIIVVDTSCTGIEMSWEM